MIAVTVALSPEWSLWLRLSHLNDSYLCLRLSHLNDRCVLNDCYLCLRFSHLNDSYQCLLFFHLNNGSLTWMIAVTTALLPKWKSPLSKAFLPVIAVSTVRTWMIAVNMVLLPEILNNSYLYLRLSHLNDRCLCCLFCLQVMIIDFWWSLLKEPDIYIHVLYRYIYGARFILDLETYSANDSWWKRRWKWYASCSNYYLKFDQRDLRGVKRFVLKSYTTVWLHV